MNSVNAWTDERKRVAAIFAPQARSLLFPDTRIITREGWYQVVSPTAPGGMANEIAYCVLPEGTDVERVIDEAVATYRACNQPTKWRVGSWSRPLDLGERLLARGFTASTVRGMGIRTDHAIKVAAADTTSAEVTLATLDTYIDVLGRGWGIQTRPVDREVFASSIEEAPRIARHFMSFVHGEPAGTAALIDRGDHGYLLGAQVLAKFRGQGAYAALLTARLASLRVRGIEYAVTHAMDATSAPILERLGFETLFSSQTYTLPPVTA